VNSSDETKRLLIVGAGLDSALIDKIRHLVQEAGCELIEVANQEASKREEFLHAIREQESGSTFQRMVDARSVAAKRDILRVLLSEDDSIAIRLGKALAQALVQNEEPISPWYVCEYENDELVQARQDNDHDAAAHEQSRRIHQRNVGWKRFSARSMVLHERIRMLLGVVTINHGHYSLSNPQFEGRLRPTQNSRKSQLRWLVALTNRIKNGKSNLLPGFNTVTVQTTSDSRRPLVYSCPPTTKQ